MVKIQFVQECHKLQAMMESKEDKPEPETSTPPDAESDSTEDKELQADMSQWKQRIVTLKNNENFEDKVLHTRSVVARTTHLLLHSNASNTIIIYAAQSRQIKTE